MFQEWLTNIDFLQTISIYNQEKRLWELIKRFVWNVILLFTPPLNGRLSLAMPPVVGWGEEQDDSSDCKMLWSLNKFFQLIL